MKSMIYSILFGVGMGLFIYLMPSEIQISVFAAMLFSFLFGNFYK